MKITDAQVNAAYKTYCDYPGSSQESIRAALESLQLEPPTPEEIRLTYAAVPGFVLASSYLRDALTNFIHLRNNPLKPDPRRVAILHTLEQTVPDSFEVIADKILQALDEVK